MQRNEKKKNMKQKMKSISVLIKMAQLHVQEEELIV